MQVVDRGLLDTGEATKEPSAGVFADTTLDEGQSFWISILVIWCFCS